MHAFALATLVFGLAYAASACSAPAEPRAPAAALAGLTSESPAARESAAEALRGKNGPTPEAIVRLYRAIKTEQNPKAFGAMLVTLGASGVSEARPLIDARVNDPDSDMQHWARTALKLWLVRNHQMAEDEELPPPPHRLYGPAESLPSDAPGAHPTPGLTP